VTLPEDAGANVVPTRNYGMFANVKELGGKTVAEYLTGEGKPVSAMEDYLWSRWRMATARLQQQAGKGKR
jgi:hypothetical protein